MSDTTRSHHFISFVFLCSSVGQLISDGTRAAGFPSLLTKRRKKPVFQHEKQPHHGLSDKIAKEEESGFFFLQILAVKLGHYKYKIKTLKHLNHIK